VCHLHVALAQPDHLVPLNQIFLSRPWSEHRMQTSLYKIAGSAISKSSSATSPPLWPSLKFNYATSSAAELSERIFLWQVLFLFWNTNRCPAPSVSAAPFLLLSYRSLCTNFFRHSFFWWGGGVVDVRTSECISLLC